MYSAIFLSITLIFSQTSANTHEQVFNVSKSRVSIIDNDKSILSEKLSTYIKEKSKYAEIKDTSTEGLNDALFFRNSEYIIIIPENFGEKFFTDEKIKLQTMRIPNSTSGMFLDTMINKYLNTAELYNKADMDLDESLKKLNEDLSIETKVKFTNGEKAVTAPSYIFYFNYLVYPIVSILILSISGITMIINETEIKRRNVASPVSTSKFSMGLLLANSSVAIVIYALFAGIGLIIYKDSIFTQAGAFTIINGLIFTILSLSLCFLISNFANNKTISPISTVLSLLICFTGGVFIPQQLLSESLKNVAVINPAFWYVKANNLIGSLSIFNLDTLKPVIFAFIVQLSFAAAFLAIALVIIKQRRTSEVN
jgi:ABC-2 type transport system permease protein